MIVKLPLEALLLHLYLIGFDRASLISPIVSRANLLFKIAQLYLFLPGWMKSNFCRSVSKRLIVKYYRLSGARILKAVYRCDR